MIIYQQLNDCGIASIGKWETNTMIDITIIIYTYLSFCLTRSKFSVGANCPKDLTNTQGDRLICSMSLFLILFCAISHFRPLKS